MSIYTTTSNQISFEMHSTLEQFNDDRNILKMTTGSADLDSLIDGIQEGDFYLFYGSNHVVLDAMAYGFLVNCVLPTKQSMDLSQWEFALIMQTTMMLLERRPSVRRRQVILQGIEE